MFLTCAAALAVLARHFLARRERWWAAYFAASTLLMLAIFFASFSGKTNMATALDVSLVIGWMGVSVVAMKLLTELTDTLQMALRASWEG